MTRRDEVIERWRLYGIGTPVGGRRDPARSSAANVFQERNRLYSYGLHFELGRIIDAGSGYLAVLNGDRYSITTSRHQTAARGEVERNGVPHIILPFSAVARAGIDLDSIRPIEILPDTWETVDHESERREDAPRYLGDIEPDENGRYRWTSQIHHLGGSVFSATTTTLRVVGRCADPEDRSRRGPDCDHGYISSHDLTETDVVTRYYVSGFDENERTPLYFLAELPARPRDHEHALRLLRPPAVRRADRRGLSVLRQGDIFGVPADVTTRKLRKRGATIIRRGQTVDVSGPVVVELGSVRIDGTSHVATELATLPDGKAYARGCLYHEPGGWRTAEHRRVKLGNGRTWYLVVRNTVPRDPNGNPRAWTISGSVD